jgi:hypothetical protein
MMTAALSNFKKFLTQFSDPEFEKFPQRCARATATIALGKFWPYG